MDINQWLQRTVTARDEDAPELRKEEDPTRIRHRATNREAHRALSPAAPKIADANPEKTRHRARKHKRKASSSTYSKSSGSASTKSDSGSEPSSSSSLSAPSEHFERRKRHKTRENLYEPHSGERKRRSEKKHKDEVKERKGKKKHRRTEKKRKEAKKPGQNLINNFSADRVHHDRLTLQPGASIGLFKKGRASSPAKQRGLPDLVFSEMKFLQKPRQQPETSLQKDSGKERKKRNKRQDIENAEVSAFFSEKRPPIATKDENRRSTANTVVTHSSKPRSRTGLVLSIDNPRSDNRERHHSRARSHSAKPVMPEDSITNVNLDLSRVFSASKVMLAGQYEQSSAYSPSLRQNRPIERSEPVEVSSKSQQQVFRDDKQVELMKTDKVFVNPAQHDKHNQNQDLTFEARHLGNDNAKQTINTSGLPLSRRPLSSSMTMLLGVCDKAMEQKRRPQMTDRRDAQYPPTIFEQPQIDPRRRVPSTNATEALEQVSSILYTAPRCSHPENMDCVKKEHTYRRPQHDTRPLLHKYPLHKYTREYDASYHFNNEHEQQHAYAQQRAPPEAHHNQYYSQLVPWIEDVHQPIKQQCYTLVNHPQDQALQQNTEFYHQGQDHSQYHHYDRNNIEDIQYEYYPDGDCTTLPNNTYANSAGAGVLGYRADGTGQQFVAEESGYGHYLQHDERTGIEEELDYELYGQVPQPEEVIDHDEAESNVVPNTFWRPRRLY